MSRTITPLQMNIVGDDGEVKGQYSPETYAETVTTGSVKKSESLELPGTDPSETLTDTIAKVKLYLDNVSSIASEKREVVDSPDDNSSNIPSTRATASLKASLDAINAIVTKNKEDIATKAPIAHADAEKTYGGGTEDLYGHVKTTDKYVYTNEDETAPTAADSVAASPKAVADAYTTLDTAKAPVSHASTDTKYGSASLIDYGHVKASDTYKVAIEDGDAEHGVVASQKAVNDMYKDLSSNQETGIVSRAPIMHADGERTYGAGTESLYGHVKISDNYDMEDVETKGNAANGMAASLFALHRSNAALQAVVDTKLPSTHATEKATAEKFSHVKLTDNYQTSQGSAADGVGVSSKALADSFAKLNASIITAQNSITSLNSDINTMLNRGVVKSIQFVKQWVKLTNVEEIDSSYHYTTGILQVNINQVNPAKSIVLFDGDFSMNENINNNDGGYFSNDVCGFEIHSIESRCVKFRYNRNINNDNVDTYSFHVVFQLVEFY